MRDMSFEEFDAFVDRVSPQTRRYVLDWLISPWALGEMLAEKPEREAVLQELSALGVIRMVDGWAELYPGDMERG